MKIGKYFMATILMVASVCAGALELPAKPLGFVNDFANQMTEVERASINQMLGKFQEEKKVSIVMVTAPTTESFGFPTLTDMSVAIFNKWKIGNAERSSGILVLVIGSAPPYKARITTGRGMEGAVTDLQSKDIVDRVIKPPMNSGRYAEGVVAGAQALMALTGKEFTAVNEGRSKTNLMTPVLLALGAFLLVSAIVGLLMYRNYKKKEEAEARERARKQAAWDAMPPRPAPPAPRPRVIHDPWRDDITSHRMPRRAPSAPPPYRSPAAAPARSRSRDDGTTYVAAPVSTPAPPSYGGWSSSDTSSPSPSVSSGGSTAGGGGGDL